MTRSFSETELVSAIDALTPDRLATYVRLRIVLPLQTEAGPCYREIDLRRITLLCELADDMELNEDALVIVMSLLDQLHGSRARLETLMRALSDEEDHVRARILRRLST